VTNLTRLVDAKPIEITFVLLVLIDFCQDLTRKLRFSKFIGFG
jgi:hypothetical protein